MNVKKRLQKVLDYVDELEAERDHIDDRLSNFERIAQDFAYHDKIAPECREEFLKLLGDEKNMYIGGDFVVKYSGTAFDSIKPDLRCTSIEQTYSDLVMENFVLENANHCYKEENARLREQLRWRPVSELPPRMVIFTSSKNVLLKELYNMPRTVYYSHASNQWVDGLTTKWFTPKPGSKWCYIPDDKDGE